MYYIVVIDDYNDDIKVIEISKNETYQGFIDAKNQLEIKYKTSKVELCFHQSVD